MRRQKTMRARADAMDAALRERVVTMIRDGYGTAGILLETTAKRSEVNALRLLLEEKVI